MNLILEVGHQSALEARPLILDLAGVSFIGSPALAVLIDANKHHPDLRVVCANRNILRIFEVAGLRSWMRVSPSLPAALADQPRPTEEPEPL
jgi:anti-anti-sigma factor